MSRARQRAVVAASVTFCSKYARAVYAASASARRGGGPAANKKTSARGQRVVGDVLFEIRARATARARQRVEAAPSATFCSGYARGPRPERVSAWGWGPTRVDDA